MGWVSRIRSLLPKGEVPPAPPADATTKAPPPPPSAEVVRRISWLDSLLEFVLLGMLIIGGILTACTGLIKVWALLGYVLLAASPIVYRLQRLERRLLELETITKEHHQRKS